MFTLELNACVTETASQPLRWWISILSRLITIPKACQNPRFEHGECMDSDEMCANANGCPEQTTTSCYRAYGCETACRYLRLELASSAGVRRDVLRVSSQRLSLGSVKYREGLLAGP